MGSESGPERRPSGLFPNLNSVRLMSGESRVVDPYDIREVGIARVQLGSKQT